jgi:hypothetical protein
MYFVCFDVRLCQHYKKCWKWKISRIKIKVVALLPESTYSIRKSGQQSYIQILLLGFVLFCCSITSAKFVKVLKQSNPYLSPQLQFLCLIVCMWWGGGKVGGGSVSSSPMVPKFARFIKKSHYHFCWKVYHHNHHPIFVVIIIIIS